ncbi:uncharacterized protein KY384_001235 [Bacidia gigantensis]|uniref:uncharacterized protein n=1 Tax=Bacidia gigantensis TaxID=2732470 RepID=UPI001D054956|nr:uncharacterized protein KY384_001235 [Bacidia gigantensis]KAG8534390.1 hypothetical protein KY384_001235 [Bacidia gigantensis]
MPPPPQKILVLGAGELGLSVLSALCTHPSRHIPSAATITVLLRTSKPSLTSQLTSWGVETVYADIAVATKEELAGIFGEYDTVIGCTGMGLPGGTQIKSARAVLQAGKVREHGPEGKGPLRYLPWQFGVDYDAIGRGSGQDLFDEQLDVRELLRGQDVVKWVILSTGMFMSFLFEEVFGVVEELKIADERGEERGVKVRALGGAENKVTVTSVEDIGRVVAQVVFEGREIGGVVFTAGQTVGYRQLAEILGEVLGRKVEVEDWSVGQLRAELDEKPDDSMRKYRLVFAAGKGVWWDEEGTLEKQIGLILQDVKAWCLQNLRRN